MLDIAGETAEPNELFLCGKLMGIFGITSAKKFRNIDFFNLKFCSLATPGTSAS